MKCEICQTSDAPTDDSGQCLSPECILLRKANRQKQNIENQIIKIIRAGEAAEENSARRPIREQMQNADDAFSDRIHVKITDEEVVIENDGEMLWLKELDNGLEIGTLDAILDLEGASKQYMKSKSGAFGTGLRTNHLYSDTVEIHGMVDHNGTEVKYVGICKPFSTEVDTISGLSQNIIPNVRPEKDRPNRKLKTEHEYRRLGVAYRLPWRKKARNRKWESMVWGYKNEKNVTKFIEEALDEIIDLIPGVLLGCRWLREAVISFDIKGKTGSIAWARDFNIHENLNSGTSQVSIERYATKKFHDDGLIYDFTKWKKESKTSYALFSHREKSVEKNASAADLLPTCMIFVPLEETKENGLPYTPISLTIDSGNIFSPLAFLPPHESRTKIFQSDLDEPAKEIWAAKAMWVFCNFLLPKIHTFSTELVKNQHNSTSWLLNNISRNRPENWFGSSDLSDSEYKIELAWDNYIESVSKSKIFPSNQSSEFLTASDIILIDIADIKTKKVISSLITTLGYTVLSQNHEKILSRFNEEDWGAANPLRSMRIISSPLDLKVFIENSNLIDNMKLDILGDNLVEKLIQALLTNPKGEWESADCRRIPIIPDSEGKLWPLLTSDGQSHFYSASENFPDILPNSRTLHPDFVKVCKKIQFKSPPANELARLIHEASLEKPEIYNNLQSHSNVHKQISLALVKMSEENFPSNEMREQKFIPCLHKGKIILRGLSNYGDQHIWPLDSIGSTARTSFYGREMIFGDSAEERLKINLHKLIFENLYWLELHPEIEDKRAIITEKLKANKAISSSGINIIRSLIFAAPIPTSNHRYNSLFYRDDNGEWELDKWLERKLTSKQRDEILDSLLLIIKQASELNKHGGMSSGWGEQSRQYVHSLYLLKDENKKWSTLSSLCYDLPAELSKLFGKTAVYEPHKNLLGVNIITNNVGETGGAGLGVTHRINEQDIIEMVNSLRGQSKKIRSKIIEMMLQSEVEWEINELKDIPWVPRTDGEFETFDNCLLPTKEMQELFGANHPWFVDTDLDFNEDTVISRARDLGIIHDHENAYQVHRAFVTPENMWKGMNSNNMLQLLMKTFKKNPEESMNSARRDRLPNTKSKEWMEGSWLVPEIIVGDLKKIYPERNIVGKNELGISEQGIQMVQDWILTKSNGPTLQSVVDKLSHLCEEKNPTLREINSYWKIIDNLSEQKLNPETKLDTLLFPVNGELTPLYNIAIAKDIQIERLESSELQGIKLIDKQHEFCELLKEKFAVVDLSEGTTSDELNLQINHMKKDNYSETDIQRYWLILSNLGNKEILFSGAWWLSYTNVGFKFFDIYRNSRANPDALVPEKTDSLEEIKRMAEEKLPLLWLPRQGVIMDNIYVELENRLQHNFLRNKAKAVPKGPGEKSKRDKWPAVTEAIKNVVKALNLMHRLGSTELLYSGYEFENAYLTRDQIRSRLIVSLSRGAAKVYWKDTSVSLAILPEIDHEKKLISFTLNINQEELDDSNLVLEISKSIGADQEITRKLVLLPENRWDTIASELAEVEWKVERDDTGILEKSRRDHRAKRLSQIYGQCQICNQITPSDTIGGTQESVVSLFRDPAGGGRYYSQIHKDHPGNYLYLCPNHFALYRRSGKHDLLWLPEIDKLIHEIRQNPDGETASSAVNKVLSDKGDFTLQVKTFEKRRNDGNAKPTVHDWTITWKGEHANQFRDALTIYIENLVKKSV